MLVNKSSIKLSPVDRDMDSIESDSSVAVA